MSPHIHCQHCGLSLVLREQITFATPTTTIACLCGLVLQLVTPDVGDAAYASDGAVHCRRCHHTIGPESDPPKQPEPVKPVKVVTSNGKSGGFQL